VGAGDAFTSAALAFLHRHDALRRRGLETLDAAALAALLAFANDIAAETCTRPGADPPRGR
jgi:fructokinase